MNNHIDITFDFETCATTANAAVMQVAAVAWDRYDDNCPFNLEHDRDVSFNEHIDLRTCVVDGFDFEQQTTTWWSQRSEVAKQAVTDGKPEPVEEVFARFTNWMEEVMHHNDAASICLWCQGMDFDGAILRNVCKKYDLLLPCKYQQFRDCRTVILEAATIKASRSLTGEDTAARGITLPEQILANDRNAYALFKPLPDKYARGREAHDALYDAIRSSWNTWQALRWMRGLTD